MIDKDQITRQMFYVMNDAVADFSIGNYFHSGVHFGILAFEMCLPEK